MRFPLALQVSMVKSFIRNAVAGRKIFPLVLMLEPTHRCNLYCAGCDRIRLHNDEFPADLTLDECVNSIVDSGAPVITITGGEPLMYPDVKPLIQKTLALGKHIYLCSNGLLMDSFLDTIEPTSSLTLNIHLDGMEETHDRIVDRPGTFRTAVEAIKKARRLGFRVSTNTSVYKNTDIRELEELFGLLKDIDITGILVAPAFSYETVGDDIFLSRDEVAEKFGQMEGLFRKYPFMNSPLYLDFLMGKRDLKCTPWGNPTRNPLGWKSPCYLITDRYYKSFAEMIEKTDWERYENRTDPRCRDCMVHSGFEASAARSAFSRPCDLLRMTLWNMRKN
jgi:hopanoid biosynthesis associated radical SAM protein HpnH